MEAEAEPSSAVRLLLASWVQYTACVGHREQLLGDSVPWLRRSRKRLPPPLSRGWTRWSQLGVRGCEVAAGARPHASRIEFVGGSLARPQSDFPSGSLPLRRINGIRVLQLDPALRDNCFNFSVPNHKRERCTEQLVAIQNLGKTFLGHMKDSLWSMDLFRSSWINTRAAS